MSEFDAYRKWLGIPTKDQPPNHYRLLGIELFESDAELIEGAADKQMSHVRQYQSGAHANAAAKLLNELATARLCLLKPSTKKEYDAKLKSERKWIALPPNQQRLVSIVMGVVVVAAILSIYRTLNPIPLPPPALPIAVVKPTFGTPPVKQPPKPTPPPPKPVIPKLKVEVVREWRGRLGASQEGVFSQDGDRIVYADGADIFVENTVIGSQEIKLSGHTKQVWLARFSPDNKRILSFGEDATLRRWDRSNGSNISTISTQSAEQGTVLVPSSDGTHYGYSYANDKRLAIQQGSTGRSVQIIRFEIWVRAISPDLNRYLTNGVENHSSISILQPQSDVNIDDGHHNYCGQFASDGEHVIVGGGSDWDLWNVSKKEKLKEGSVIDGHIYAICVNKTLDGIAMGVSDGSVWFWNGDTTKRLDAKSSHKKAVKSVMLSPDGTLVLSGDESGAIILWQLPGR
eukprot:TRINITY_DN277_c0_g2_i4.p1 TRINITY_DN277_c0_g2~~TRINITY_DN277_c0_g2_i4.p1  ORF type:complete len:458 (-),score=55.50 TRINITY_DN277_c0_g2_i4:2359-3732(-)